MKKYLLSGALLLSAMLGNETLAQDGVGIGTPAPDASAILHIQPPSNNKGLLIPRLDDGQMGALGASAAEGLLVYNTTRHDFYFFFSGNWRTIGPPPGTIVMWSGSIANIPVGWLLCDGTNSTPDLRERFVVGAGSSDNVSVSGTTQYAPGDLGGSNSVTLTPTTIPGHSHVGVTDVVGAHTHSHEDDFSYVRTGWNSQYPGSYLSAVGLYSGQGTSEGPSDRFAGRNKTTGSNGNHSHNVTITSGGGGGQPHENRPPYYALAYIMKQ